MEKVQPRTARRLLYIGSGFYDYDSKIENEIKKCGYAVDYFCYKGYENRYSYKLSKKFGLKRYYNLIKTAFIDEFIESLKDSYDIVLFVTAWDFSFEQLNLIKMAQPKARFILYLWDPIDIHKNKEDLLRFFDTILSFDKRDCKKYKMIFRPLFYRNDRMNYAKRNSVDISFIGGWHDDDRYDKIRLIKSICLEAGISYYLKMHISKLNYLINRIRGKIQSGDKDLFINSVIPYKKYLDVVNESKCIFDHNNVSQEGLTIRVIESLAMSKKIITTNQHIREYKEIPQSQYFVLDRNSSCEDLIAFIKNEAEFHSLSTAFSLHSFVQCILNHA